MAAIIVLGSLNMDIAALGPRLPQPGETLLGSHFHTAPGGKGANQAYAAAKLGADVAMLGRVGSDDYGRQMRANLESVGCDIAGIKAIDGSSGVAMILVTESGQNCIVVVPGANHGYLPHDLAAEDARLARAQFVMLQLETPVATVVEAGRRAKQHGAQLILDPAPAVRGLPPEFLQQIDVITPNETEAAQLIDRPPGDLSTNDASTIARQLQALGPSTVIIKRGAQGCLLAEGPHLVQIPAPIVKAIDTTAAGDIFNAALTVARAEGGTVREACEFAVLAAAISVTRYGAQTSAPSMNDIRQYSLR
jgi:ribokinase